MKRYLIMVGMCLAFAACRGPSVCDCDAEAAKENPDDAVLEECRGILGGMEMEDVLKALKKCN